jgi:2-polyprenyl-3-methyl-5-hydroxy-6-metoxy-1,4-benzoquinol methylase
MRQNHLEYYKEHGIAPVRYDMNNIEAHLDRRESLYTMLGLLPLIFRDASVLEVAAGTGHNSLYVAAQMPQTFVLLEPNPPAVVHIHEAYANFDMPHTAPEIITETLENYHPARSFDIVICENWLGTSEHELNLLNKLATFVVPKGLLIVTTVSPIGFIPNLLRRFLMPYIAPIDLPFDQRTKLLEQAFTPHLKTLANMTRNATDWVQDNMLNPAYFGLCLSAPKVISQLGDIFEVAGAYPSFVEDWRWFKGLYGEYRRQNEHFLEEYWTKCHNFMDNRAMHFYSNPESNQRLEASALKLLSTIKAHEDAHIHRGDILSAVSAVVVALELFIDNTPTELADATSAINEFKPYIAAPPKITIEAISKLQRAGALFGRETSYLSLKRH